MTEILIGFVSSILKGNNRKEALMKPIPFGCGSLKFCIQRSSSLLNKLYPLYTMFLESGKGLKVPIVYARKLKFKTGSNYSISL